MTATRQGSLGYEDACHLALYRIANLRKLFPCIPDALNDVLRR